MKIGEYRWKVVTEYDELPHHCIWKRVDIGVIEYKHYLLKGSWAVTDPSKVPEEVLHWKGEHYIVD